MAGQAAFHTSRMTLFRLVRTALTTVAAASAVAAPAVVSASTEPSAGGSLRILMVNDDGWDGGGLLVLREALLAAGHDVVVFAPADDQSGNSGRITLGKPVEITQQESGVFSVGGSPADSVEAGMSLAFRGELPDLVVSGPNPGANIANATIHSGTIGAAMTAVNEGVPAIAVSTNGDPAVDGITNPFVVDLVAALVEHAAGGALLPDRLGLNVNIPSVAAGGELTGVEITVTDTSYLEVDYSAVELPAVGESVEATGAISIVPTELANSDSAALDAGHVAITFVQGNYDLMSDPRLRDELMGLTGVLIGLVP
jgi:5'/3'-nucleotidase SurE